jgi:4-amino-4-deoxy-L-arabinose transferase-like glycosyltransferase
MKKFTLFMLFITLIAFILRVYKISEVPPSLYWEEAAIGYDAYSVVTTGKDYHGNWFPILSFPSFGDYKPSLYFYAVAPLTLLFGRTEFAVRLPSALAGALSVFFVMQIAYLLYGKKTAIFSGLLLALQPWGMHLSRVGFETNLATMLITGGVFFVAKAKKHPFTLMCAAICFGFSTYAYHAARVAAPLIGIASFFLSPTAELLKKNKTLVFSAAFVGLLFLLPILLNARSPQIAQRAAETSIFSDISVIEESNRMRELHGNSLFSRIVYHRYVMFAEKILQQYARSFSLSFLFLEGDENIRHQTQEFGLLYPWELITVLLGVALILQERKKGQILPIVWILLAAIPVAVTTLSPHTLRFAAAGPAFAMLSGLGMASIFSFIQRQAGMVRAISFLGSFLFCSFFATAYLHYYFTHYTNMSAKDWQFGYKELVQRLDTAYADRDQIFVTREQGRPSIYFLFYGTHDLRMLQANSSTLPHDQLELLSVGKYRFVDAIPQEKGSLIVSSTEKVSKSGRILETLPGFGNAESWVIWEQQ